MKYLTTEDRLLLPHELARTLGVSISWVRNHAAPSSKNPIPTKRVGRFIRFDLDEVLTWVEKQREVRCG